MSNEPLAFRKLVQSLVDRQNDQVESALEAFATMGSYFGNEQRKQLVLEGLAPRTYRACKLLEEVLERRGKAPREELLPLMDDPDPAIAREAVHQLVRLGLQAGDLDRMGRLLQKPQKDGWEPVQADVLLVLGAAVGKLPSQDTERQAVAKRLLRVRDYAVGTLAQAMEELSRLLEEAASFELSALDYWPPRIEGL